MNFWNWWVMQFSEKLWDMWGNIEIHPATTKRRRNYLVSERKCHTTIFLQILITNRNEKKQKKHTNISK